MELQPVSRLTVELHARRPLSGRLEDDTGVARDFHSTLEFIQLLEELPTRDGAADETAEE